MCFALVRVMIYYGAQSEGEEHPGGACTVCPMPSITDNETRDEQALIQACIARDSAAWDEFVRRYGRLITGVAASLRRHYGAHACETEDMAAFVYERLLADSCRRLSMWQGRARFSTYLVHVAQNLCRDYLAKHGKERFVDPRQQLPDWLRGFVPPPEDLDEAGRLDALRRAIEQLPPRQAMVIRLRIEGKTLREIGEIMRLPDGTVFSLSRRAVARLREILYPEVSREPSE